MKEIKFDGVNVKDRISAKVVGSGEISVYKVNTGGMLFETTIRLNIRSRYRFQLEFGKEKATLSAKVNEVLWKKAIEKDKRKFTLYQVAVEFEKLKSNDKAFLDSIIEKTLDDDMPEIVDRINEAKFHIED